MRTYLIPTTAPYTYEPYDYVYMVYANSPQEAYYIAKEKLSGYCTPLKSTNYESYEDKITINPNDIFHNSKKYDIFKKYYTGLEGVYNMELIDIYDYMYWGNYNYQIQKLAEKALPEKWSFEGKDDNYILKNYLKYTFNKLQEEEKVI